ncbi:sushi, von Willebrand factor type A, EGF and pentraxin domain-containing protein 1 isoform X2 [Zootermopsis nevadensis]|uniref:sushi, von Willebrand factor type A, EGF and pentraxin domain-containing protein 1 isoform X2 n=1 Tax=Zootermopsis nevadensis TaxID=136037 RepID=UPI000B8E889A|nr:sushi, von Willebrand factor type A, EGF and pentraxin domain-containing protein 1 isoform X2 [Zootermopsis nevadensis]
MRPHRSAGVMVVLLILSHQLVFIECRRGKFPAGARKRSQRTVPRDSAEDIGASDEVDDDGRVYKNPRNSPSALCPRDEEQATLLGQKCLRKCSSDEDCKSKKKKCLCDAACGMSCIKPERECGELTSPALGSVSLSGRFFGDRATYSCDLGFHVVGLKERTCQADGTWSGHSPACKQNIYCTVPPHIEHARHNTLPEQTTFDLDSTLHYQCYHGYVTNGFPTAKCLAVVGVASWYGPDISCVPRLCGPPADVSHGWHAGECYTYGCRVTYHCADGYELVGRSDRHCQDDGTWSPKELPACVPVQCPTPENPSNGKAIFTSCSYNSVVSYECKYGYTLVGEPTRRCGADKRWSGVMPQCKEINCGHPGPLYNGWLENIEAGTGLGASIIFRCHEGMKLIGKTSSVCQIDGHWRYPLPLCLAPCVVPRIQQGRVVLLTHSNNTSISDSPQLVQHGEKLSVDCEQRYEFLAANSTPVECNNGTWTHIPRCEPARCKRMPKAPRNGMVIAPKTEHGMRARFKCKDGYTLLGDNITKCLFGNWTGVQPYCQEVYCPFPGYIENGRVMLVGNMGVYDYRPYVRKVTNNKQIMYECERGYVLTDGPPGATCIGGRWSPKQLPRCVPGMHPRLRWSRSVHARRALLMAHNQSRQQLWQRDRQRRNKKGRKAKKRGGKGKAGPCEVISEESFLNIEVLKAGRDPNQTFSPGTVIRVSCGKGYGLNIGTNVTAKCVRGQWKPSKPECLILPCHVPVTENGIYKLNSREGGSQSALLNESSTIENGEVVEFSCKHGYNVQGPSNLRCWHGKWAITSLPDCTPAPCELPMITNGQYLSGYRAGLTIANGSSVTFQCDSDYSKSTGQPIECILGELRPRVPACRHHTLPIITHSNGSSKHLETNMQFKGGSDITKGGDIGVIDFPAGFRRTCGPPARVQGSLVYRDGEPIGETDRSFPDGTEVTFNCIASIMGEKTTWRIICEDGSWVGRSLNCEGEDVLDGVGILRNSTCIFRNTEPNVVSFYNDQQITEEVVEFPPGSLLVSRCVDIGKYSMIGSNRRRCVGGEWDGQKPVCFGLNQENDYAFFLPAVEKPPTILFRHQLGPIAQSNDGRLIVYPGTIVHMECLWIRRFGTPKWVISHNYRKYPEGWTTDPGRDSQLEYRLSIYHASRDDSGVFTCVTPTRHTHAVEILVKAVHCPMIPPRRGMNLSTLNTKMNTRVLLSCANGNSLIGAPEITCLPSGNWSAPIPICESIECADLVNLTDPHLRVSILSREVGGRAVFSCAQGYGLRGPHEAVCQHTGDWASPLPTCQEVQCDTPGTPDNGYIQGSGPYKAGDVIQFNCNPEFMMEGQPIIACQENGRWSGTVPKCMQACSYPGTTISGRMSAVKFYYKIGETITFTCDDGLELRGAPMLRCLRNGKWSNAIPTCVTNSSTTVAATTTR